MGSWIKRHKGLFIFLCIFTTFVLLIVGVVACSINMSKKVLEQLTANETVVVERRDLVESISASGTIVSSDSAIITAGVSGVEVKEVYVELGDWVEAGTLICTLDSSKIEDNLAIAQANLAATEQSLAFSVASAQRTYNDAVNSQNQANANAQITAADAERNLALANESYSAACTSYNNVYNEYNPVINTINEIINYDQNVRNQQKTLEGTITSLTNQIATLKETHKDLHEGDNGYTEYIADLTSLEGELTTASAGVDATLMGKVNSVIAKCGSVNYTSNDELNLAKGKLESSINSARISKDSSYNQLCSAQASYNSASTNANTPSSGTTVANARDNLTNAQTQAEIGTLSAEQQIASYEEQIEKCAVYAPISGVVTAVNCKAGDTYAGAAIVTVENTTVYDVETYISEYDIGKIKVGQEVVVKTNGTGDLELEGVVKSIAPRATASASGVSYKVIVQINTECDGLRLDMTAKLSIILNKAENVITVPYESVQTDDDGNTYVEISKGKNEATGIEEKEKVYVTTGVESAYYIEITSGAITEGSEVIVPRSEFEGMDIYSLLEEEGALGGY